MQFGIYNKSIGLVKVEQPETLVMIESIVDESNDFAIVHDINVTTVTV
jgi:hypothetical protein